MKEAIVIFHFLMTFVVTDMAALTGIEVGKCHDWFHL